MLYFTRWKALAIILTALVVCLCAVPNFFPEATGQDLAGMGAAAAGARPRPAGRLVPAARGRFQLRQEREARPGPRRRAPDAARRQDRLYRPRRAHRQRRGSRQGYRSADRADQAARAVAAARRAARLQRPAQPRGQRCRRRTDPPDGSAGGDHRAHPPDHRAVDPDRRAPRQRARHRRAADPAPGHRPHPGAGAGPAGSDPPEGAARQDRQDGIPHGRLRPCRRIRRSRAGCRRIPKC